MLIPEPSKAPLCDQDWTENWTKRSLSTALLTACLVVPVVLATLPWTLRLF